MAGKILYSDYLQLDKILSAQAPFSEKHGKPAHEEMLFIITHQVYELWFKQVITDLDSVLLAMDGEHLDDSAVSLIMRRIDRINAILKLMIDQFGIMETMDPIEFLEFRNFLGTMTGFQSMQFRVLENKLGLLRDERMPFNGCPYDHEFRQPDREELQVTESEPSLFSLVERWLERTPFLERPTFKFLEVYEECLDKMIRDEGVRLQKDDSLTPEEQEICLRGLKSIRSQFRAVVERKDCGGRLFSRQAMLAALFIRLYSHLPMLSLPDLLLTKLVELEASVTHFRYRHSLMALRMIGQKPGTGGTSGVNYLRKTADKHQIFTDLHRVVTLLIPKSALPPLPEDLERDLNFHFTHLDGMEPVNAHAER